MKKRYLHGFKTNVIRCRAVSGIYEGKEIKVYIGTTGNNTQVIIDGVPTQETITGIWITMLPQEPTKLTIEMIKQ